MFWMIEVACVLAMLVSAFMIPVRFLAGNVMGTIESVIFTIVMVFVSAGAIMLRENL